MDGLYSNNAWQLDDKFMTFQAILSEQRMDTVINAITLKDETNVDDGRPDIAMIFFSDPAEVKFVDIVVVEIKSRQLLRAREKKEIAAAKTELSNSPAPPLNAGRILTGYTKVVPSAKVKNGSA